MTPSYLSPDPQPPSDEDDPPQSLLALLVGNIALGLRSRAQARDQEGGASPTELTDWNRVVVGYLALLSVWCWDDPAAVKEALEEGGALGAVRISMFEYFGV